MPGSEIQSIANDKMKLKELLEYELFAQPSLMPLVARTFGSVPGAEEQDAEAAWSAT